ncbi:MAG: M23 family metallopeptidase, partial [Planctomycetes bacterium]|nr:M23 family metallopeptidase [Planctomycetota bacterium]
YFDAKGRSARKALMRTPIDGARLSSVFGRRRHPILGYNKLHRGVDFAAPRGTPIYAAGNGVIVRAGRNGAYGKYVRIRHNARYATAYAHMSGFARGTRKGKRVTQGQVIGYVGTTGRSTGPHLHYEILAGGVRTNPMKLRMPSGRKLKGAELARFQQTRAGIERRYAELGAAKVVAARK